MPFDFILHLFCSRGQFSHRERLFEADFEPFVRDTIFTGLRNGRINQTEEYHPLISPILQQDYVKAERDRPVKPEPINHEIQSFDVVIKDDFELYRKRYPLSAFKYRALQKAFNTAPCKASLSTCGLLDFSIEAFPPQKQSASDEGKEQIAVGGSVIQVEESTFPVMHFERKLLPYTYPVIRDQSKEQAGFTEERYQDMDFPIYLRSSLVSQIREISRANLEKEIAGFLVGKIFQNEITPELYAVVEDQIEAKHTEASLVSVTINSSSWNALWDEVKARGGDLQLLGWWHSHPFVILCRVGDGGKASSKDIICHSEYTPQENRRFKMALRRDTESSVRWTDSNTFLSLSDVFIHNSFFSWPYQIALVVDPRAAHDSDIMVWGWRDGTVTTRKAFVILEEEET